MWEIRNDKRVNEKLRRTMPFLEKEKVPDNGAKNLMRKLMHTKFYSIDCSKEIVISQGSSFLYYSEMCVKAYRGFDLV